MAPEYPSGGRPRRPLGALGGLLPPAKPKSQLERLIDEKVLRGEISPFVKSWYKAGQLTPQLLARELGVRIEDLPPFV